MKNNYCKKFFVVICVKFLLLTHSIIIAVEHKKPMKILMIVARFPKISNISNMNQITGLIDRGHTVHIFSIAQGDYINLQEDVIKYDLINKMLDSLPIDLNDYDIVMFQMGHKLFDIRKTHNFKGKIVVCLRGYDITVFLQKNPHAYDHYFNTCDLFMPVCEAFKKLLIQAGCNPDKIIVHHSSIDCSKFKFKTRELPKQGTINIISAGRFVEKKGLEYAIRAIAKLLPKYPNIQYTLVGDGKLKQKYQKLIEQLKVGNNIKIDGWHTHEEYIKILNKSHIFILPSVTAEDNNQEGIPNVLKEAMAMGLLVIATKHSGNVELIEHEISGFLVPERRVMPICEKIEYLLNHTNEWLLIQFAAAYKVHQEFEKEKENDKLEAIFYDLLQK